MPQEKNLDNRIEARELKVKVPVHVHVQLHSVKILTGRRISDVVTEALAQYFADDPAGDMHVPPGLARVIRRHGVDARDAP